ncbi:MAG: hypothetical protein QNJ53_23810 [Pleurocapsa sp. MO_192.B19]|nr:hypothetical protein [Pleurocapsa sp. MO_192.B19]
MYLQSYQRTNSDRQNYVFVVNETDGKVEQRKIEQGIEGLAKKEIIEGVEPGEKLVTEGKNRLVNGAPKSKKPKKKPCC